MLGSYKAISDLYSTPQLRDEIDLQEQTEKIKQTAATYVERDLSNEYVARLILDNDFWRNANLLANDDLAYGGKKYTDTVTYTEQTVQTIFSTAMGFVPGGSIVSALATFDRALGQTTENVLKSGIDYDKATSVGVIRG